MPKYTIDGTTLSDVADAVRELDGNPDTMTPAQMAGRIRAVQPGGADLSVIADDYDTTATYDVGDYCIHEGGLYVCTTAISTAEAWTAGHWEEVTVGDELSDLKSDLNQTQGAVVNLANNRPKVLDSDASGIDLDVTDPSGNVLLRLADGHVQTKNFNSQTVAQSLASKVNLNQGTANQGKAMVVGSDGNLVPAEVAVEVDDTLSQEGQAADAKATGDAISAIGAIATAVPQVLPAEETEADLYISDYSGNVIGMFVDGHIKTKNFDSSNFDAPYTYKKFVKNISFVAGTTQTVEMSGDWKSGDRIVFHIDDGTNGHSNKFVTYYADNTSLQENTTYAYAGAYYDVILPVDASVLKVSLGGSLWSEDKTLIWEVYKMGTIPIVPKIITVSASGGADYTSIRDAIDSIEKPSSAVNPYIVKVYKGTYDTIGYYSDEEIATASGGDFVGLMLYDGVSLLGAGTSPEEVVLTADMDTTKWSVDIRNAISTLNREGTNFIENVKIIGSNVRYSVHDDFWSGNSDRHKALIKNCVFVDDGLINHYSYGMGSKSGQSIVFENCDFGIHGMLYHTNRGGRYPCKATFRNCIGYYLNLTDYGTAASGLMNNVAIHNCAFDYIAVSELYSENGLEIIGTGSWNAMIRIPSGHMYNLGNVARFTKSSWLTPGKVVSLSDSSLTTGTYDNYYGVCIGSDDDYAYILKYGYLCSALVGLTGLAVGDYITVANGEIASGGTQSNAIGVVKRVNSSDGVAYIQII